MAFVESKTRSVVKAITFRILIVIADYIIIFTITKSSSIAIGVIIFSNISSTIIYFLHERTWNKIGWGKRKKR